ncbi:MAG TPA: hypothetical protein VG963_09055 [Polyangiaceae bacterium]|nr:hypothetical protein [Polyangiaceae bacterium]
MALTPEDLDALKTVVVGALERKIDELEANIARRFEPARSSSPALPSRGALA